MFDYERQLRETLELMDRTTREIKQARMVEALGVSQEKELMTLGVAYVKLYMLEKELDKFALEVEAEVPWGYEKWV